MKKIQILTAISLFLFMASVDAQNHLQNISKIDGKIKGTPDGTKFYLIRNTTTRSADTVQQILSKNQKFHFEISTPINGELHFIKMESSDPNLNAKKHKTVRVFLEGTDIQLEGEVSSWPIVNMTGTSSIGVYDEFFRSSEPYDLAYKDAAQVTNDTVPFSKAKSKYVEFIIDYLKTHSDSYATPLLALRANILTPEQKLLIFNGLTERLKHSFYGIQIRKNVLNAGVKSQIALGNQIPDFQFETVDGKTMPIMEKIRQSKITLIDFWASWCQPCRVEIPFLKAAYSKYKNKGFGIISVAVRDKNSDWKKALKEEGTTWLNGIEQNGEIWNLFDLQSIPVYALVDQEGKIIAFQWNSIIMLGGNIRQENLEKKLAELLK